MHSLFCCKHLVVNFNSNNMHQFHHASANGTELKYAVHSSFPVDLYTTELFRAARYMTVNALHLLFYEKHVLLHHKVITNISLYL